MRRSYIVRCIVKGRRCFPRRKLEQTFANTLLKSFNSNYSTPDVVRSLVPNGCVIDGGKCSRSKASIMSSALCSCDSRLLCIYFSVHDLRYDWRGLCLPTLSVLYGRRKYIDKSYIFKAAPL